MILKNPAFKKGLKPIQKLGYLSSMTFWFFPFPRLIFMLAPLALHPLRHQDLRLERR